MLTAHLQYITTANQQQLIDKRSQLEALLQSLRDPEVRRDTQQLLRAIDRCLLNRVMQAAHPSQQAPSEQQAAKAA